MPRQDLKILMQVAMTRMRVVKNKQQAKNQHTMRDIAELLANHRFDNARYKVSQLVRSAALSHTDALINGTTIDK
jgi:ribosomal protein L18E